MAVLLSRPPPQCRTCAPAVVRDRVMEGVARLLAAGDNLTFAKVAAEAAVPERTVNRHFPTRETLLAG